MLKEIIIFSKIIVDCLCAYYSITKHFNEFWPEILCLNQPKNWTFGSLATFKLISPKDLSVKNSLNNIRFKTDEPEAKTLKSVCCQQRSV